MQLFPFFLFNTVNFTKRRQFTLTLTICDLEFLSGSFYSIKIEHLHTHCKEKTLFCTFWTCVCEILIVLLGSVEKTVSIDVFIFARRSEGSCFKKRLLSKVSECLHSFKNEHQITRQRNSAERESNIHSITMFLLHLELITV